MSARARYLAHRRALGRPPALARHAVRVRGLDLAVWTTPPVPGGTPAAPNAPAAPPVCCVSGGLLFDHRSLWPSLQGLAATRQLVFYDQRGRGASARPPGVRAARLEHDAGDLAALVRALRPLLGVRHLDLLGHSWGGGIAMLAAAEDAAAAEPAVRRLALVDPVGVTGDWLPGLHARGLAHLAATGHGAFYDRLVTFDPAALAEPDPALHGAYAAAFLPAWFADPAFAALFAAAEPAGVIGATIAARLRRDGYDWRDILRGVRVPSLVVQGEADVLGVAAARATVAWLGAAAPSGLEVVAACGHMPFWEAPGACEAALKLFLDGPTLAS